MNRKALSLFMAGSMIFATGCGSSESNVENVKDIVNVDVLQFKVEFKDEFEALAEEYNKAHPNVRINVSTIGGGQDYNAVLKSKIASGNPPAVFNIGGPQDVKDYKELLSDLSDTKAAQNALSGTLDGVKVDDKVLGLPYDIEGYGFVYNKKMFEQVGINPAEINSFAKLEEAVKKLDAAKDKLGIESVIALPAKETWLTGQHTSNLFLASEFADSNAAFNAKTVEFKYGEQFKKLIDLQNDYSVQPTLSMDYSTQVEKLFALGKVAMIQQGNWIYGTLVGIDEDFANNDVGLMPIPVDGVNAGKLPVGVPYYWVVNSQIDNDVQLAAKDFLNWMYTSDEGKEAVVTKFNFAPAYSGCDVSKIVDPMTKTVYEYFQNGKSFDWVFMGYPSDWAMGQLGAGIQKYILKEITWDDLIKQCQARWIEQRK